MTSIILLLYMFWFLRTSKHVLFWLYLWQLKEYHVGRFLDHFKTYKGKKLIFDLLLIFKIILAVLFLLGGKTFPYLLYILLLLYSAEIVFFLRGIFLKTVKIPKITFKTLLLAVISFIVLILFLLFTFLFFKNVLWKPISLLVFDILTSLIISLIVLLFQPFFVFLRNRILVKAKKKIRGFKNLTVIGITGSYGKTSTKEFLTTILSKRFKTLSTKNHQNSEIGIAKCILNDLKLEHEIFVVEMGSYNKGGIKLLCDMVRPKIGVVTGVNEQHLALFGSLKNLLSAEGGIELAASLPKDGLLVLNGDNKYCLDLCKKDNFPATERKKIYSINRDKISSDIWTEDITVAKNYISFLTINTERELAHFQVNVLGKYNIQNILAAVLVAKELGMGFEEIAEACNDIRQEQAGMIFKKGQRNINIIDSSYSSNPDGVIADLDYLSVFPNKRVIVMPCLIELGEKSEEIHRKLGEKIGKTCDIAIITTKDRFEDIKMGAMKVGMKGKSIVLYENSKDIYSMIMLFCKEGDTVLLEGRVPGNLIKLLM